MDLQQCSNSSKGEEVVCKRTHYDTTLSNSSNSPYPAFSFKCPQFGITNSSHSSISCKRLVCSIETYGSFSPWKRVICSTFHLILSQLKSSFKKAALIVSNDSIHSSRVNPETRTAACIFFDLSISKICKIYKAPRLCHINIVSSSNTKRACSWRTAHRLVRFWFSGVGKWGTYTVCPFDSNWDFNRGIRFSSGCQSVQWMITYFMWGI